MMSNTTGPTASSSKQTLQLPQRPLTLLERIEMGPTPMHQTAQAAQQPAAAATLQHWQNNAKDIKGKTRSLRVDEDYEGELQAPWFDANFEGTARRESWSRSRM